ncbi:MAG: hypothetical protein HDR36_02550 [Treponema sp.]|nr:hypothetical protein [Treponema sp.]
MRDVEGARSAFQTTRAATGMKCKRNPEQPDPQRGARAKSHENVDGRRVLQI